MVSEYGVRGCAGGAGCVVGADAAVDDRDALLAEPRRLFAREVRDEMAVRAHDAPPRDVIATGREERAHGARPAGVSGLVGDPAVRERVAGWELGEHGAHRAFEVRHGP